MLLVIKKIKMIRDLLPWESNQQITAIYHGKKEIKDIILIKLNEVCTITNLLNRVQSLIKISPK